MLIQHVLAKETECPVVVEWVGNLRTGLERLAERDYQAILLDLNLPDSSGFETFAAIRPRASDRAVIVLTGQEDEALALQAVRAGADDYLIKSDIRVRFLARRIRYAVERNRLQCQHSEGSAKNGKILTFVGAKGGAGTSTLVINVAAVLARAGKTAIAIELTPEYGSFAGLLNCTPSCDIATLLERAPETMSRRAVALCLENVRPGFRALCGPRRVEEHRPLLPGQARSLLGFARTLADYILVDVPSIFAASIEEVVQHSTFTAMVLERNRLGLGAAQAKLPALKSIAASPGTVAAVLIGKTTFTEFLTPAEFSKRLGCGILAVIPPAADLHAVAESDALTALSRPESLFSQSIVDFARRLNLAGTMHGGCATPCVVSCASP
jgi:Flp pilus assembly CpaE family ATPase